MVAVRRLGVGRTEVAATGRLTRTRRPAVRRRSWGGTSMYIDYFFKVGEALFGFTKVDIYQSRFGRDTMVFFIQYI